MRSSTPLVLLLSLLTVVSCIQELDREWEEWKIVNNVVYGSGEEPYRRLIWENNVVMIQRENTMGNSYTLRINQFGDLTSKEFISTYLGRIPLRNDRRDVFIPTVGTSDVNDTVDWRTQGYVTDIKDQKQCGSCWAFSATGSLEGQYKNKTGKLVSFSEQQLVDCSRKEGNLGCEGGDMDAAFKYIEKFGIEEETSYPYKAHNEKCKFVSSKVVTKASGYKDIKSGSVTDMKLAVCTVGPIAAAMDASHESFQFYSEGIYKPRKCKTRDNQLDHGVLAIGYGVNPEPYWLMKNSWGKSWGIQGYFKIEQANNKCGICTSSSYPIISS